MRYYAVYDTNVLISSLLTRNKDSATAQVVDAIVTGEPSVKKSLLCGKLLYT